MSIRTQQPGIRSVAGDTNMTLQGENIICFAKDWDEVPTSNNHVMMELAKSNRVLWLNSVATRTPSLASGRDLRKIVSKLRGFLQGARQVRPNLWVYTALLLPFPNSRWAAAINRQIMRLTLGILRRRLKMRDFQLWTFLPTTAHYAQALGGSVLVYYCVDEWAQFTGLDSAAITAAERQLCQRADIVFATSQSLADKLSRLNPRTHLARHGVDHALFARALDDSIAVPRDIAAIKPPVLGFYGTIQDWVDLDLIEFLARRRPDWSIVLIGQVRIDVARLRPYANVHFLGVKAHADLPGYCKAFAVGLLPQKVNALTVNMNPMKLREYLSAGLPVVATALPEVARYGEHCRLARTYEEFETHVRDAIASDSPAARAARSRAMKGETWEHRVAQVSAAIMNIRQETCSQQ